MAFLRFVFLFLLVAIFTTGCTLPKRQVSVIEKEEAPKEKTAEEIAKEKLSAPDEHGFIAADYLPENATNVEAIDARMNVSSTPEKVLIYKSYDAEHDRNNQHLKIFSLIEDGWTLVKEDIAANDNTEEKRMFTHIEAFATITEGRPELLLVENCRGENCDDVRYYIVGYEPATKKFADKEIPKGYLHPEEYLDEGENKMILATVEPMAMGAVEKYNVYCGTDEPNEKSSTEKKYCRSFSVFQSYDGDEMKFRAEPLTSADEILDFYKPKKDTFSPAYIVPNGDLNYLYPYHAMGCGGCLTLSPNYLTLNSRTDEMFVEHANPEHIVFSSRCIAASVPSRNETKVACVEHHYKDNSGKYYHNVWVYDFLALEEKLVLELGEDLVVNTGCHIFCGDEIRWNSENEIEVDLANRDSYEFAETRIVKIE